MNVNNISTNPTSDNVLTKQQRKTKITDLSYDSMAEIATFLSKQDQTNFKLSSKIIYDCT